MGTDLTAGPGDEANGWLGPSPLGRAHGLLALAAAGPADEQEARRLLQAHGRDWLGQTAAIFVTGQDGGSEAFSLPCRLPDRAVLAQRPHIRPLLVALQRCPAYFVAALDKVQGTLLRVTADHVIELEHGDFRTIVALLERMQLPGGLAAVVAAGQSAAISQFTAMRRPGWARALPTRWSCPDCPGASTR